MFLKKLSKIIYLQSLNLFCKHNGTQLLPINVTPLIDDILSKSVENFLIGFCARFVRFVTWVNNKIVTNSCN